MSVNRIIAIFGILLVIFITFILFQFSSATKSGNKLIPTSKVTINGHTFNVAVARTPQQQQQGLSGITSITDDQGMLFLFNKPAYYSFWMKDMRFSIDIIYIKNNKVTYIVNLAPTPAPGVNTPPIFQPTAASDKVLEINAGLSKKYTIKEGTQVDIKL